MRALLLALSVFGATATLADDAPLTADQFDALTRGATFDTYDSGSIYGIEKFLPGRRSIWQDAERCMYGTWAQVGDQICFTYEDDPANPDCWTYFKTEDSIIGYLNGDETIAPITLLPSVTKMTCDDYIGA
jgi:hypothetical protein